MKSVFNKAARLVAYVGLALTSACASHPAPPPVLIPVATPCVRGSDIPAEPAHVQDQLTGDSGHDIGVIAGSAIELRAWGLSMRGMLIACADTQPIAQTTPQSNSAAPR